MDNGELGLGLFEAFTIIGGATESAVHPSISAGVVWLRSRLLEHAMSTAAEVHGCTAAIFDAGAEEVAVQWHGTLEELAALLDRLAG